VFGAVLLLVLVDADGSVHGVHTVCATHSAFIPYARANIAGNRYRPALLSGVPVRDSVFVPVVFNPYSPIPNG
jgi:hypothetical protein